MNPYDEENEPDYAFCMSFLYSPAENPGFVDDDDPDDEFDHFPYGDVDGEWDDYDDGGDDDDGEASEASEDKRAFWLSPDYIDDIPF